MKRKKSDLTATPTNYFVSCKYLSQPLASQYFSLPFATTKLKSNLRAVFSPLNVLRIVGQWLGWFMSWSNWEVKGLCGFVVVDAGWAVGRHILVCWGEWRSVDGFISGRLIWCLWLGSFPDAEGLNLLAQLTGCCLYPSGSILGVLLANIAGIRKLLVDNLAEVMDLGVNNFLIVEVYKRSGEGGDGSCILISIV